MCKDFFYEDFPTVKYNHDNYKDMAPCPFCGQQGDYYIEDVSEVTGSDTREGEPDNVLFCSYDGFTFSVECCNCGAKVYGPLSDSPQEGYDNAIKWWNHRA